MIGQSNRDATCETGIHFAATSHAPLGRGYRILLAHIPPQTCAELRLATTTERYSWIETLSATEAFAAISAERVDLVIAHADMPEVGGVDLCRVIKKAAGTHFLPVFVIDSQCDEATEVQAIEAGADAYLVEPLRSQPLHARIQAMLRHKSMIESLDDPEMVLFSLAQSVEDRDPALRQHCERLSHICSALGLAMGLTPQDVLNLQRAAFLHDIGKVAIPDSILLKPDTLTPDEWAVMQSHAERGERICKNIRSLDSVLPIIRHHHEKWDGTGYPDGLAGENIPLLARILQTADIYDALTTERPYKQAFTSQEALQIMLAEAQKGWRDPSLTAHFAEILPALSTACVPDLSQLSIRALAYALAQSQTAVSPALPPGLCA